MNKIKYILLAFSLALFACSEPDKTTGTSEDENTLAKNESSSSSEDIKPESSSSSKNSIVMDTIIYWGQGAWGISCGAWGSSDGGKPDTIIVQRDTSMITVETIIKDRVEMLVSVGMPESEADSTVRWELYKSIGIDTLLTENPNIDPSLIDNALDYVLHSWRTPQRDPEDEEYIREFFKEFVDDFTASGILDGDFFCLLDTKKINDEYPDPSSITRTFITFGNDSWQDQCSTKKTYRRIIPVDIVSNIGRKCFGLPYCNKAIRDTIINAAFNLREGLKAKDYICREAGWDIATVQESATYGSVCDQEGKYAIIHDAYNILDSSFICSLDSGWHKVETIDAETFGEPCDKGGKLFESPNRSGVTYVCRMEPFCRHYDYYSSDAPCMDKGWDYANENDFEMATADCDSNGKTLQSPRDSNLYYICQDGNWSEFYNRPCDTDNQRIRITNTKVYTKYTEYICYNKTWRPTYEWHTDYPAEYYFNPEIDYGSFTDPRDNYVYHTVEFEGRTWITENMKYAGFTESELAEETRCLDDSCKNIGRFYSMNVAGKVCPEGWSLPDYSDILTLGTRQPETEKNISQLGGTGGGYSAPDTYGLSFILSGRITEPGLSPWQGFTALLWMNETDEGKGRLIADICFYENRILALGIDSQSFLDAYSVQESSEYLSEQTFLPVRCVKK